MADLIPGFSKLRPFHGEIASLWFFVATHTHLVIRVHHRTTDAEVFILADGCSRVEASAAWVFHLPEITAVDEKNVQLVDVESGFRVVCESARVQDSYEILQPR